MGHACNPNQTVEPAQSAHRLPRLRVFVGVKIAPTIARQLTQFAAVLKRPFVRPVAPTDIHLTLVPPWNVTSLPDTVAKLSGVVAGFGAFPLLFQHVSYGPEPKRPRLVWAECAASDEISALRSALLHTLGQTDDRPFLPHVTLARIRGDATAIARRHPIDQVVSLTQRVEAIELFQSPSPGATGYQVLASLRLAETQGPKPTV
jgi:RNA 2',3'-cyclic 3'-phosphodiesterase